MKYPHEFSQEKKQELLDAVLKGANWLAFRFTKWEAEVKYPFGPADVAQIVITLIFIRRHFPQIFSQLAVEPKEDLSLQIIKYLLHIKTNKSVQIQTVSGGNEDVATCWWDDYFSTAEVIEALAEFHAFFENDARLKQTHQDTLDAIKKVLIKACTYFDQGQVDGMWGSHIDTIKVITAYVMIRPLLTSEDRNKCKGEGDALVVPEIHTTFKALRWICDKKQIFSDGSFMHTMFLTIFYARALIEVYKSWEPAKNTVQQVYDDVVWFSPACTTPERSKRLATTLKNSKLRDELEKAYHMADSRLKFIWTSTAFLAILVLSLIGANLTGVLDVKFSVSYPQSGPSQIGNLYQYVGVIAAIAISSAVAIWTRRYVDRQLKAKRLR